MKYASIYVKNYITGSMEYKGEAILLNKMDERTHEENKQSFWEFRYLNRKGAHCAWVDNNKIKNREKP